MSTEPEIATLELHIRLNGQRWTLVADEIIAAAEGLGVTVIGTRLSRPVPAGEQAPPAIGWHLTDDEAAEVLAKSEQRTQAHQWYHSGVPVGPAPGQPIFGPDGREAEPYLNTLLADPTEGVFPLTSFCRCGRQITQLGMNGEWEHSD